LRKNDRLPTPVITPTTKGLDGAHDVPLPASEVVARGLVEPGLWAEACAAVLELFHRGSEVAARAGLILVDTKYELGVIDGRLCVIDEIHTPDSSRYWLADTYAARHAAGEEPLGLDKEYVRRWLKSVGYAGEGPPPVMPDEVVVELARRYIDAYERLTGEAFVPAEQPAAARIQRALAGFVRAGAAAGEEQGNGGTL
jgi:phosphoribosylaminoimidazole-succinocarboxamide synthase